MSETIENENIYFDRNYALRVTSQFNNLMDFADIELIVGEERIPAHRIVLAAASEYFLNMFKSGFKEAHEKKIYFNDTSPDVLKTIVKYIYKYEIDMNDNDVVEVLKTACMMQLDYLIKYCCECLLKQMDTKNCIGIMMLADLHSLKNLKEKALNFIYNNFLSLLNSPEFYEISVKQLCEFLKSDSLAVNCEEQTFNCVKAWICHDKNERHKYLFELLQNIKLPLISPSFIAEEIKPFCEFSFECLSLIMMTYENHIIVTNSNAPKTRAVPQSFNEDLYIIGDFGFTKTHIFHYDPIKSDWSDYLSLNMTFKACAITLIDNNEILIMGGTNDQNIITNRVQRVCTESKTIIPIDPLLIKCHSMKATTVKYNDRCKVYVAGGNDGEKSLNLVQRWDSSTKNWEIISDMIETRQDFGLVAVENNVYAIGGWDGMSALETVEVYNEDINQWCPCSHLNVARREFGVAVVDKFIYVVGGVDGSGQSLTTVERYDTSKDQWTFLQSLPNEYKEIHLVALTCKKIVCLGKSIKPTLIEYIPEMNIWNPINVSYKPSYIIGAFVKK